MPTPFRNALPTALLLILVVIAGAGLGAWWQRHHQTTADSAGPAPVALSTFQLVDQDQQPFGRERLAGHWTFLFFGYTHCPDVCPFTLAEMDRVYQRLATSADGLRDTQFVFVSVDPKRDTPEILDGYVKYFNKTFIGATAARPQLDALTGQLGVHYEYVDEISPSEYTVNHSASIFLIDPQGRLATTFSPPHEAADISERFLHIRSQKS